MSKILVDFYSDRAHDARVTNTENPDTDPTTMTPEEIDSILFPLWAETWKITAYRNQYRALVAPSLFPGATLDRMWGRAIHQLPYIVKQYGEKIQEFDARLDEIRAEVATLTAEYNRRGGWTRYILCGNNNGHLHYDSCHTLKWTTRTLLVPQASGLDATEVVGRFGTVSCSKCFPGAPV